MTISPRRSGSLAHAFIAVAAACAPTPAPSPAVPRSAAPSALAAVPETARGVAIDWNVGYATEDWGGGLHWITDGTDQALFLVTSAGVVVFDAPPNMTDKLLAAIAAATPTKITHVVYSHYHADHIGGAGRLGKNLVVVAQRETAKLLARAADPARPVPTVVYDDAYQLVVGDQTVELRYPGPNHVPGNAIARFPKQRVVMAVDIVWPGWVPFVSLGQAKDLVGYRAVLDTLLTYDFDHYVGGHIGRPGTKADVEATRAYVNDLFTAAGHALAAENIMQIGKEVGFENPWNLVNTWFDRMSARCAREVVGSWKGKLGGVDVWPQSHCLAAIQSLRID